MASTTLGVLKSALDWASITLNAPFARAVVFGVPIGGHYVVEVLLGVAVIFLLLQKSDNPPRQPLTEREVDELCDDWHPEPLIPPITEDMLCEPPVLESAAGPHAVINVKDTVNFASANYLGLIGYEKLMESCTASLEKYGVGSCGPRGFYETIGKNGISRNLMYMPQKLLFADPPWNMNQPFLTPL